MSVMGSMPPLGPAGSGTPGFFRSLFSLRTVAGAAGLTPALVLLALQRDVDATREALAV